MPSIFGFRMLQGKGGASGHLRTGDDAVQVQCRGLIPGENYHLYRHRTPLAARTADHQGQLSFTAAGDGFFFLCDHALHPVLWETGEDGTVGYYHALKLLPKPATERKETGKDPLTTETKKRSLSDKHSPDEEQRSDSAGQMDQGHVPSHVNVFIEETAALTVGKETFPHTDRNPDESPHTDPDNRTNEGCPSSLAAVFPEEKEATTAGKESFSLPDKHSTDEAQCSEQPIHANEKNASFSTGTADTACRTETLPVRYRLHPARYRISSTALRSATLPSLRTPSAAPLACSLPVLQWPDSLLHISSVLRCGQPFSNLGHPGFRCVKLPCPNPSFPYCIVGYRTSSSRISALLYALPGHPMLPPRGFADCRFQQNHWLRVQYL